MTTPPTQGQPHCRRCHGHGYVVRPVGEWAQAAVCDCVPRCERCGGTGQVSIDDGSGPIVGRCRCQILPDRVALFNRAGIPARHANSTLVSFDKSLEDVTPGFIQCQAWLESFRADDLLAGSPGPGLVLHGPVGRGKTHLLTALLRELVFRHGVQVRFIEFTRLLGLLREGYGEGRSDAPVLDELAKVPVLGIDELGKGRLTDFELAIIDEIISRRYNGVGCTLGTTNYAPGDDTGRPTQNLADTAAPPTLGDRVGARVHSRLREMGRFVSVRGPDHRTLRPLG